MLATIRRTGFGSSLQDLLDAGKRLGLSAWAVTADEAGLRALPKPVVAFVEHDHFIAVTRTTKAGVTYLCSDCGCWPGGERRLSWKQWKLMEAGPYCSIVRTGSAEDRALAVVVGHQQPRTRTTTTTTSSTTSGSESASASESLLRLAAADVKGLALRELARVSALTALLKGHVLAAKGSKASTFCGGKQTGQHCVPGEPCCPMAGPGGPHWGLAGGGGLHAFGPGAGDPVNLATLEEEYTPAPDLVVYNPHGPAVVWSRIYNSMRPPNYTGIAELANDDHFGVGWSHSYNVGVFDPYVTPIGCIPRGSSGHSPLTGTDGPSGGVTWDTIQGGGTVATSSSYQELDEVSQIVTTGTGSPPLRYAYDYASVGNGEPSDEFVPFLHTIEVPSPTGTGSSTATINYEDDTCYVTSIVDGNGNQTVFTPVSSGTTKVEYKDPMGTTVLSYTTGFGSNMSQTSLTDGSNSTGVESITYGDANDPQRPSEIEDANGKTVDYTWDQFGHMLTQTGPRGTTSTLTWDYGDFPLGRLTEVGEGTKTPCTFTYYEPSGLLETITTPAPGTSGGGTVTTTYTYSGLGSPLTVTLPGNNATSTHTGTNNYTTDGMYSQSEALGQPVTRADTLGNKAHFRYTSRGRVSAAWDPYGNETDTTYNIADQVTAITLPATGQTGMGHGSVTFDYLYPGGPLTTVSKYDESNSLVRELDLTYGEEGELLSRSGTGEEASLSYDAAYRTTGITDGNSHTTAVSYTSTGYLYQITYPGGDWARITSYDDAGHPLERTDSRGVTIDYEYTDDASRLSDIEYPGATSLNVHIDYDSYGRPSAKTDAEGSYSYSYDDRDVCTSVSTTYTGLAAKTLSSTFYDDGSRETLSTPAGDFTYTYDENGRLTGLENPNSETTAWSYLDNGWLHTQTLANGAVSALTYNALGQKTDVTTVDGGSSTLTEFGSAAYDGAGNRTSITATVPGHSTYAGTTTWAYDSHDRLTQESSARAGGYTENFAYDSAGNPATWKGASRTYNSDNQHTAQTYDSAGNPTTYGGTSMTYDRHSRLTAVGSTLTAGYTSGGKRAWKQGASLSYFLYDGGQPLVELNGSGAVTAYHTFGAAGLISRRASSTSSFYTFDLQGSLAQKLDASCNVSATFMFDAYGVGTSTSAPADPWGYRSQNGQYTDLETGLQCLGRRYYDSGAGRFLNRDPIGQAGGVNVYSYCRGNPVMGSDPSGLACDEDSWAPACNSMWGSHDASGIIAAEHFADSLLGMVPYQMLQEGLSGKDCWDCPLSQGDQWSCCRRLNRILGPD